MSRFNVLVSCVVVALTAFAVLPANATTIYVDFGMNGISNEGGTTDQRTGTYNSIFYNDVGIVQATGVGSTTISISASLNKGTATTSGLAMKDITTAATGWTLTFSANAIKNYGEVGTAGTGANYTGTYPSAVSGFAPNALKDSIYASRSASLQLTFSGLNDAMAYNLLAYGARVSGGGVGQGYTPVIGTGSWATVTFNVTSNSATVVDWEQIRPVGGKIAFSVVEPDDAYTNALNFLSIQEVTPSPEPSTLVLTACGLLGLLAYAWRKRK